MSRLTDLIEDVADAEREDEQAIGADGEIHVPWQVFTLEGRGLTVHYFTNATNEVVCIRAQEDDEEVRVTVIERRVSGKLPGQFRAQTVTLPSPLGARRVIDGATGRRRERFVSNPEIGWAAFDAAAAEWLLAGDGLHSLQQAARNALEDGCRGNAIEAVAAGGSDLEAVYFERGVDPPDHRAAAKLAIDAALAEAEGDDAHAEGLAFVLEAVAESGRLAADQREQLAPLLALSQGLERALATTGNASPEADRLVAAARALREGGGLRA